MSRPLSLFCIGLVFGGGVGFLVAAANGIALDGHDHGPAGGFHTKAHTNAAQPTAPGHGHEASLELAESADSPTLGVAISRDAMSGWNLHIVTEHFEFAPDHASGAHVAGEGHAHIYVNGEKVARHYGPWFHLADLPRGRNTIDVTLNANDHRVLSVGGKLVKASLSVDVD